MDLLDSCLPPLIIGETSRRNDIFSAISVYSVAIDFYGKGRGVIKKIG